MAIFNFENREFYIDGKLKEQLDTKVLPALKHKDKDVVFIVDGKERSGKSKFADILAAYCASWLQTPYDINHMCLTPEEFRDRVQSSPMRNVWVYDEAHRGMGSRRALSEVNNLLIDLMMEMGQRNLFIIIVLPTFFMLDRYPALYRTKGLFHVYERKGKRGFWAYFNEKNKLNLYIRGKKLLNYNCMKWPKFRGRFLNQYAVDEAAYRQKKAKAFNEKPRITKAETYMEQRNNLLYAIYNLSGKVSIYKLYKLIKPFKIPLTRQTLGEIVSKKHVELGEIALAD